ncbi:hypothetical protein, partial [Cellulomonas aerilata]
MIRTPKEVVVVADDVQPDDASRRSRAVDLSRLPAGLATALADLRAAMDTVRSLTVTATDL